MTGPLNVSEFEAIARERLDLPVYDYYAGGSDDEVTLRENIEAFQRMRLKYRVLVDVSERDLRTTLLGTPLTMPIILAPTALHRMAHPEGESATARAAASMGTIMTLSTISSVALEEVAQAAPDGPRWFQLYHFHDRARTEQLVARAVAANYGAIVLTVDAPVLGRREKDLRHPFMPPEDVVAVHLLGDPRTVTTSDNPIAVALNQPSVNWTDLTWLRSLSDLPLLIKGVVRADDAKRAIDEGCAGVWVSNHGGRQLDTSIATADAVADVVDAVDRRGAVIVDGGIRRGTDALKALALGADAVAIGRPQLWGLAADGENGVRVVLEMLRDELSTAMALAGCPTLGDIDRDLLA